MDALARNHVQTLEGGDPTLIYANGFGCNQSMWTDVVQELQGQFEQVLFDYVGSGKSDLSAYDPARYAHLQGYAQDLIEVCEACDIGSDAILVAHSVSCTIGMLAAIQRPDLFKHLVLIGPNPCFLNDPGYVGGFERAELEDLLELMDRNFMGWADFLAPVVAGADERASRRLNNSFCSTDPAIARRFAEATFFADNRADLPLVSTPCLVLQHGRASCCPRHPCCDSPATAGCFPYLPFYRGSARRWRETYGLAKVCQEQRGRLCSWCPSRPCRPVPSAECFVSHQSCSPTCPASCSFAFQPSCLG